MRQFTEEELRCLDWEAKNLGEDFDHFVEAYKYLREENEKLRELVLDKLVQETQEMNTK